MNCNLHANMAGFHSDSYIMWYGHALCMSNSIHNTYIYHTVPYCLLHFIMPYDTHCVMNHLIILNEACMIK